jgi:CPA2 family monovalent cation:H+ antiporter-2
LTAAVQTDPVLAVLLLMGAGLLAMAVSARTGLNTVLALIGIGAVIGPAALGLVRHDRTLELLGELGVAFLLFDIGLHLSAATLWRSRRYLLVFAPAQIALCTAAMLGVTALVPGLAVGAWLAAALSLSSTAVVLQLLRDQGEEQTPTGRAAVSALLAQDLFVVFLLVVLPALASGERPLGALGEASARLLAALVACIGAGRLVLAPLFGWISRLSRPEALTAAALFFVLSIAWLSHAFGLSLALGAFLAGLALAESRYSHLVQAEVAPFRGLLLALFFLSVGMSIDLPAIATSAVQVLSLAAGLIVAKSLMTTLAARFVGHGWGSSLRLALLLAQASEFVFVVLVVATAEGLVDAALRAPIEAAVVLSIAATPALAALGDRIAGRLDAVGAGTPAAIPANRVVLIGFDDTMERLARALDRASVPVIAFTSDRERVLEARGVGFDVHAGDPERPHGLALAARGEAAALVIGVVDATHGLHLVEEAHRVRPDLPVYAVADGLAMLDAMRSAGARDAVVRGPHAAGALAASILTGLGSSAATVAEGVAECRDRPATTMGGAIPA